MRPKSTCTCLHLPKTEIDDDLIDVDDDSWPSVNAIKDVFWKSGFFNKNFGGGDLLSRRIFGPRRGQSHMGGTHIRDGVRWGGTWKNCPPRPKIPQYGKIRAKFWCFKYKIELSDAVLS